MVGRPGLVRIRQAVTAKTGTTPTYDVEVQSSDVSDFASGVVSHGKFSQTTTTLGTKYLMAWVLKSYMRVIETLGGTSPTYTVKLDLVEPHFMHELTDSA